LEFESSVVLEKQINILCNITTLNNSQLFIYSPRFFPQSKTKLYLFKCWRYF